MRGWSIPLGRWMGVELRVHTFFLLLAVVCLGLSTSEGWPARHRPFLRARHRSGRARNRSPHCCRVAWFASARHPRAPHRRTLRLCQSREPGKRESGSRPVRHCFCRTGSQLRDSRGIGHHVLGAGGDVRLFDQPWISPAYLLRSMVWMQAGLGLLAPLAGLPARLLAASSAAVSRASTALLPRAGPLPASVNCWHSQPCSAACCCIARGSSSPGSSS
jgi:hypothetical protein